MTDTHPLLYELPDYGSDFGQSYWLSWLGCPRKAFMAERYRTSTKAMRIPARTYEEFSGANVGNIGHALMDLHFNKLLKPHEDPKATVEYSQVVHDKNRSEGERCFKAWRKKQAGRWGKCLGAEVGYELHGPKAEVFGVPDITAKIDAVVELSAADVAWFKASDIEILGERRHLKPGKWVVDHKFYGRREEARETQALWSHQFALYPALYNHFHPDTPVQGVLQNTIYKTKEVRFEIMVIPTSEERMAALRTILTAAALARQDAYNSAEIRDDGAPSPISTAINCWGKYGGQCRYLGAGCEGR